MNLISAKVLYGLIGGLLFLGVVSFVIFSNKEETKMERKNVFSYATTAGKKIYVAKEEVATSSRVIITTEGFEKNSDILIEKETLSNVYFADLNGDTFEEVVLVFTPKLPGGSGDIGVFTTYFDDQLTSVDFPQVADDDKTEGGIFEGYVGGDIFLVEEGVLFRTFTTEETVIPVTRPEDEVVTEVTTLDDAATVEIPVVTNETPTSTKQKRITYVLLSSQEVFYMEPQIEQTSKVFSASSTATLSNTSWTWLSVNRKGSVTSSDGRDPFLFSFNSDNTFTASSSCGFFTGGYILSKSILRIGSIVTESTNKGLSCKNQSELLKDVLPLSENVIIGEKQLIIKLEGGEGVILFTGL